MRVGAYQAPHLPFGSFDAVDLIAEQVARCERDDVELLCCPEAILGGLAHEPSGQDPADVALDVTSSAFESVVAPLASNSTTVVVGFTERAASGGIFNAAAVLRDGRVQSIYRKVYPGYRTVIQAGREMMLHTSASSTFGVMICNDIWYVEPARLLSELGTDLILVPSNTGHTSEDLRARAATLPIARAVENTTTVVVADIAGEQAGRRALGSTRIVDPDGVVLAAAEPTDVCVLVVDIENRARSADPRGRDGHTNRDISRAFVALWDPPTPERG